MSTDKDALDFILYELRVLGKLSLPYKNVRYNDIQYNLSEKFEEPITKLTIQRVNNLGDGLLCDLADGLKNLQKLYIDNNKITSLPESIGNLTNLQVLQFDKIVRDSLPENIEKLNKINWYLEDN